MHKLSRFVRALGTDRSGATAIEYGLLAALIALAIIGAVLSMGQSLDSLYPRLAAYMSGDAAEPE